jgi:DNA sulfur modification protein DndB
MALTLPAVKGDFFGTPYWSGKMTLAAIENNLHSPSDQRWDHIFDPAHGAQRELNSGRVMREMVPYLTKPGYRPFFSALTVIMVPMGGDKLEMGKDIQYPADAEVGMLTILDQVMLFTADGQHRREALAQALKTNRKDLHSMEVPVVFLPFESVDRVRQLFSDLNLNAKPANKSIGLAYESRDPVVVVAKRVVQDVDLFDEGKRVNVKTNSLAAKSPAVISLNTLVLATESILSGLLGVQAKNLRQTDELVALETKEPNDSAVDDLGGKVAEVFEVIIDACPQWRDVMSGAMTAGELRDGVKDAAGEVIEPGYVFAFGIGWQALALVAAAIIRAEDGDWSEALQKAIESVDWQKGDQWHGTAMVGSRVNNTGPGVRATAGFILDEAGYGDSEDPDIESLISTYKSSLAAMQAVEAITV